MVKKKKKKGKKRKDSCNAVLIACKPLSKMDPTESRLTLKSFSENVPYMFVFKIHRKSTKMCQNVCLCLSSSGYKK